MSDSPNTDETTVIATYSTRRDAEMASTYLADADIPSFVSSDDAGGMYPQMQRPNGVRLVAMVDAAEEAQSRLEEAGLYPDEPQPTPRADGLEKTIYTVSVVLGGIAIALVLLMFVLG